MADLRSGKVGARVLVRTREHDLTSSMNAETGFAVGCIGSASRRQYLILRKIEKSRLDGSFVRTFDQLSGCRIFISRAYLGRRHQAPQKPVHPSKGLKSDLGRRGPDHANTVERLAQVATGQLSLVFHSTVLALRGNGVTPQPVTAEENGSVLCWNGEAWKIAGSRVEENDTVAVFKGLIESSRSSSETGHQSLTAVHRYVASISGPFAFVFYDDKLETLYFGRDAMGRRSLMFQENAESFIISSSGDPLDRSGWQELTPSGIYTINLSSVESQDRKLCLTDHMKLYSWDEITSIAISADRGNPLQGVPRVNRSIPPTSDFRPFDRQNIQLLRSRMLDALRPRLCGMPSWKIGHVSNEDFGAKPERIAVLFSGGLDCTVLARLADELLPSDQPIALLNVAFENPRLTKKEAPEISQYESCPDRITARSALIELQSCCPRRQWVFVAVDVTFQELTSHRDTIITLMRPHDTEMDLSIAMALYFASRGVGHAGTSAGLHTYSTSAQVLLSGLGADELFAGYVRHENAFRRGGFDGLVSELQLDIDRIGTRNLGRDDRVTAYWAREVRYPFLDESLVAWVAQLPVWQKCRFGMTCQQDEIEPAKYLLRALAMDLGLKRTAREKKRAIQFGSRSAKMFNRKTKGTEAIVAG